MRDTSREGIIRRFRLGTDMKTRFCLATLAIVLFLPTAFGQAPETRKAIREVIQAQLAAFQSDDDALAFSYASPEIQARLGSPTRFMSMVRAGYDPVYRPTAVEFQELHADGEERWVQQVLLVDREGRPVLAFYPMRPQADGSWRIGGCTLMPVEAQSL